MKTSTLQTILSALLLLGISSVTTVCAAPPPLPDFVVESLSISPTNAVEGTPITVTISVRNQGEVAGDGRYLDLWYHTTNSAPVFGDVGDWWTPVGVLEPGASRTITAPPHFVESSGTNRLFACIEFENLISETNNTNNCSDLTYNAASVYSLLVPVYHFWSKTYRSHYYTPSEAERDYELSRSNSSWIYKGSAFYAYTGLVAGSVPVYHFWSKTYRSHYYTTSVEERDYELSRSNSSWIYKGEAFYAYASEESGSVPVYHFWSKTYRSHYYTTSVEERDYELSRLNSSWIYKGVAFYAFSTANPDAFAGFSIPEMSEDLLGKALTSEKSSDFAVESAVVVPDDEMDEADTTDVQLTASTDVGDVVFPLSYPESKVSAYVYDSLLGKWTCILDPTYSPVSAILENIQPRRSYLLDVLVGDSEGGEMTSLHQIRFEYQLDSPDSINEDNNFAIEKTTDGIGSPIAQIKTPPVEGPLTVKLYSAMEGVVLTLADVPSGETIELPLSLWNNWYWVSGWRDTDDKLVLSLWLRHEKVQ